MLALSLFDAQPGSTRSRILAVSALACAVGLGPAAHGASAQTPAADTASGWAPSPQISAQVKGLVAEKWNTSPGDIHLQWGQPRNPESLELVTGVELLGSGRNGRWIALLSVPGMEGDKVSVPLKTGVTMVQPYSKVPLVRGEVLEPANMEFQTGVHWGPASELPEAAEPGWVAQRRIEAGERLLPPGLRPPDLVISGRLVELVYTSGSLTISLQGKAVGSAALGEQVYVRTNEGHRMAGIVTAPGTVLLSNPGTGGVR